MTVLSNIFTTRRALRGLALIAVIGAAACTSPDQYAGGGYGADAGLSNQNYSAGAGTGGPSDPRSVAYFNQTVGDRVLFAVDQSTLSDTARNTLSGQATWLQSNPEYTAIIEGHADEQGTREYNLALGARRANAAQDGDQRAAGESGREIEAHVRFSQRRVAPVMKAAWLSIRTA